MTAINATTIEIGRYGGRNPFRKRTWKENYSDIFGDNVWTWLLPVNPSREGSDKLSFQYSNELIERTSVNDLTP